MKIQDCYIGQKVGFTYEGDVNSGFVNSINGDYISLDHKDYDSVEVNVKHLLGVLQNE